MLEVQKGLCAPSLFLHDQEQQEQPESEEQILVPGCSIAAGDIRHRRMEQHEVAEMSQQPNQQ